MNSNQLFSKWLADFINHLPANRELLRITHIPPKFETRNHISRYTVETALFDDNGNNPKDADYLVVEVSVTNQKITPRD